MIYATSWKEIWQMHQWTREFCRIHGFKINSTKTKFIISDYEGDKDTWWLPSVSGTEMIIPRPPETEFRYLGTYISMNLTSKMNYALINKTIATWRWRALAQKIDPAQLATTVRELLFPKLELPLLYSYDVTENMCKAWLTLIIETIVKRADLNQNGCTISRASFCCLTNIPHLWQRINTLRVTEFFLAINTRS